jgi:hypothetical protein
MRAMSGMGSTAGSHAGPQGGAGLELPFQDPLDGDGTPFPAARCRDAAAVQPVGDLAERGAARLHRQDEREQVGRALGRLGRLRGVALGAAVELAAQVGGIAQLDAARLGRLGALRIHRRSSCRTGQEQGTDGPNYHEFQIVRRRPKSPAGRARFSPQSDLIPSRVLPLRLL